MAGRKGHRRGWRKHMELKTLLMDAAKAFLIGTIVGVLIGIQTMVVVAAILRLLARHA